MKETVTVKEAAERLGMSQQAVRVMLQRNKLPIGYAIPSNVGNGFRYIIPTQKLNDFLGVTNERSI